MDEDINQLAISSDFDPFRPVARVRILASKCRDRHDWFDLFIRAVSFTSPSVKGQLGLDQNAYSALEERRENSVTMFCLLMINGGNKILDQNLATHLASTAGKAGNTDLVIQMLKNQITYKYYSVSFPYQIEMNDIVMTPITPEFCEFIESSDLLQRYRIAMLKSGIDGMSHVLRSGVDLSLADKMRRWFPNTQQAFVVACSLWMHDRTLPIDFLHATKMHLQPVFYSQHLLHLAAQASFKHYDRLMKYLLRSGFELSANDLYHWMCHCEQDLCLEHVVRNYLSEKNRRQFIDRIMENQATESMMTEPLSTGLNELALQARTQPVICQRRVPVIYHILQETFNSSEIPIKFLTMMRSRRSCCAPFCRIVTSQFYSVILDGNPKVDKKQICSVLSPSRYRLVTILMLLRNCPDCFLNRIDPDTLFKVIHWMI